MTDTVPLDSIKPDYTVAEVCKIFDCNRATIYTLISTGGLTAYKVSKKLRITRESVESMRPGDRS